MDSIAVTFGVGFSGSVEGTAASPALKLDVTGVARTAPAGVGWQLYEAFSVPLTIADGATTTLDLTTGLTNPLNEAIAAAAKFVHVYGVLILHDPDSEAANVEAFGGASPDLFQGPWDGAAKATLPPGLWVGFGIRTDKTGLLVDGTHKEIDLTNVDGTGKDATVNVMILGKTS